MDFYHTYIGIYGIYDGLEVRRRSSKNAIGKFGVII